MPSTDVRAPNKLLWLTDTTRSFGDLGSLALSLPLLTRAPRGDGHGVLVIPGLAASDVSTVSLRRFLRRLGYRTYSWGLGRNLGPTQRVIDGIPERLDHIVERSGGPVSVIGWSLGGIFTRRLARREPDKVRQVITLASPIRLESHGHSNARHVYNLFAKRHVEQMELPLEHGEDPLPVPSTSIYTRLDGIVAWQSCLDEVTATSENIEVYAAHMGIGHHPAALWAVADRLAQPAGEWAPFVAPAAFRWAFPTPQQR